MPTTEFSIFYKADTVVKLQILLYNKFCFGWRGGGGGGGGLKHFYSALLRLPKDL